MKLLLSFTCVSVLLCLSVGAIPMADHEPLGLVSHEQEPDGMGGLVSQQAPLNQPVDGPITYPTDIEPPIADPDPIPPSNETHPADPSAHQSLVSQLSTIDILNTQFCHISASDQAAIRRDRDNPALVSRAVDPYIDSFTYQPCTFSPEAFCNGCHAANSSSGAEVIQSYFKTVGICEDRSPCGTQHRFCRFNASTYLLFNPAVMQDIYANGMVGDVFTGSAILDLEASLARHYVEKGVEQGLQVC